MTNSTPELDAFRSDLRKVMQSNEGMRFLWKLLGDCGIYEQSFVFNSERLTAFNEGRRSIGLWLQVEMSQAAPELHVEMIQKMIQVDKDSENGRQQRNADADGDPGYPGDPGSAGDARD